MDDIVKSIIKKDYKSVESIIAKSDLNGYHLTILHLFFYMYTNSYINDDQAFVIFYLLVDKHLPAADVMYIYRLIPKRLVNSKLWNFLKIKKDRACINVGITEVISRLKGSIGIKKFDDLTVGNFHDTVNGEFVRLIISFTDVSFIEHTSSININRQIWMGIQEDEMVHRLSLLMNLFGQDVVSFMNVPIINGAEFENLTFENKITYYKKCVSNLLNSINTLKEMSVRQKKVECINSSFDHQYAIIVTNSLKNTKHMLKTSNDLASLVDRYFN